MRRIVFPAVITAALLLHAFTRATTADNFPAVKLWNDALNAFDASALRSLYSSNPPAQAVGNDQKPQDISTEFDFWQQLKAGGARDLQASVRESADKNGLHIVSLTVKFHTPTPAGVRTRYVFEQQGWQKQPDAWRIVIAKHSDVVKMPRAGREHKRILLIFGGNWCYDCHVLDFALRETDAAPIVQRSFIVVHVDIGEGKLNPDLVSLYQIPLSRGVPALAVLDSDGKPLYSAHGEFEKARSMDPDDLIAFLNKWKPM